MHAYEQVLDRIAAGTPAWHAQFVAYRGQLRHWIDSGVLPDPRGRAVWDMGCGWGAFSLAFLAEGARAVTGTDAYLDRARIPPELFETERLALIQGETTDLAQQVLGDCSGRAPLLFMHLVSEHVADLQALLRAVRAHCREGTQYFIHHDNYYHPVGHHDHGFLQFRPASRAVETEAIACWDRPERCDASAEHRARLREERAWQWSEASEATRDPADCTACNYRLRAMPWAHLVSADRFMQVFPESFFVTALNKITPFQLRQHLLESGFAIESDVRILLTNAVPAGLSGRFTDDDLRTFTVTLVATPAEAARP